MRPHHLLVVLPVLWIAGCQPLEERLEEQAPIDYGLVPFDSLPMEWGRLVAVTPHPQKSGAATWYEMWFSDPTSGRITLVPVYRPELSYSPSLVTVIGRAPVAAETTAAPSIP